MSKANEIWMEAPLLLLRQKAKARQGEYSVLNRGNGMNFKEVRNYQYGDDVRNIDWNVSARMQDTYVKVFEEEIDQQAWLVLDISPSILLTPAHHYKISSMLASIAKTLTPNGFSIGSIFFHDKIAQVFLPKRGQHQAQRIYQQYFHTSSISTATTSLDLALQFLLQKKSTHAKVFILSDFLTSAYTSSLAQVAQGCEVFTIMISGMKNPSLKNLGLLPIQSIEGEGIEWQDTHDLQRNLNHFQFHLATTERICKSAGAHFHHLDTTTSNQSIIL